MSVKERVAIDISWASRRLAKSCSDDAGGWRRWGADHWRLLQRRLAVLAAAPTMQDLVGTPGRFHPLHADRAGDFAVLLWGSYRLVFTPDHDPVPGLPDGGIDLSRVTKILIKEVVDYHGN